VKQPSKAPPPDPPLLVKAKLTLLLPPALEPVAETETETVTAAGWLVADPNWFEAVTE
jgi:hypothetical protein